MMMDDDDILLCWIDDAKWWDIDDDFDDGW